MQRHRAPQLPDQGLSPSPDPVGSGLQIPKNATLDCLGGERGPVDPSAPGAADGDTMVVLKVPPVPDW